MEALPEYSFLPPPPPTLAKALKAAAKNGLGPYAFDRRRGKRVLLGSGFTASVYRVRDINTGEVYAAKFLPSNFSSAWDANIFSEAARRLDGRGVVPEFKGSFDICEGTWIVVVMSILAPIPRKETGTYKRYANSMRRCLKEFHDAGFAHGDIHLDNFMIDPRTDTVRLIDFGLSYDYRAPVGFLPYIPRGKRSPDIKDWSWITSRIDRTSLDSLRVADYLIDTTKLESIIEMMSL